MGKSPMGAEVFNGHAPDTGNMKVFETYGIEMMKNNGAHRFSKAIRRRYSQRLPEIASSDAANISMCCMRDGYDYGLNSGKW